MEAMHYAAIFRGVSVNAMYQGFRAIQNLPIDKVMASQYGGHFQYLTIQGLILACVSMVLGMVAGILNLNALKTAKRYVMMVAMPVAVVIALIYWSLLLLFPSLIMPAMGAEAESSSSASPLLFRLPLHVDLSLHALPAASLILDFFLFEGKYSKREVQVGAPFAAFAFALWYAIWVEHCGKMNNGIFPYPFLTENTQAGRIAIYAGATLFSLFSFRLINRLHRH